VYVLKLNIKLLNDIVKEKLMAITKLLSLLEIYRTFIPVSHVLEFKQNIKQKGDPSRERFTF